MNKQLATQLSIVSEELMSQLLTVYTCCDWGCSWVEFLEHFTAVMLDTIGNWQSEDINSDDESEDY